MLSSSQQEVVDIITTSHRNVFLTGGSGVGKSHVIQEIKTVYAQLKRRLVVTAMTGRAAVNIGGITFHSFLRINPTDLLSKSAEDIASDRAKNKYFVKEIRELSLLIVDEVSMMEPILLEFANVILRRLRGNYEIFGGLQTLFVGDFFQLPPVGASKPVGLQLTEYILPLCREPRFIFQTELFYHLIEEMIELTEVWRQSDPTFSTLLNRLRKQEQTSDDVSLLKSRVNADLGNEIIPTQLSANNKNVEAVNKHHLSALSGPSVLYSRRDGVFEETPFKVSKRSTGQTQAPSVSSSLSSSSVSPVSPRGSVLIMHCDKLKRDSGCEDKVEMKIGSQVMLTVNMNVECGLVNGSRGVVIGFTKAVESIPSATKKTFSIDDESIFSMQSPPENCAFPDEPMPIVLFTETGRKIHIPYYRWSRDIEGLGSVYCWQIPLKLAWSTTIHKSQGMSLSYVDINLDSSVFEEGQAYVAISRVRSLEGLRFSCFSENVIRANPHVISFYNYPFSTQREAVLEMARKRLSQHLPNVTKKRRF